MSKIIVKDTEINIIKVENEDYICITDMIKAKDGDFFIMLKHYVSIIKIPGFHIETGIYL